VKLFSDARTFATDGLAQWQRLRLADLQFLRRADVRLMLAGAVGLLLILLIARSVRLKPSVRPKPDTTGDIGRGPERHRLVLPALPPSIVRSRGSVLSHVPQLFFLLGLPFFALALGDPYSSLVGHEVSFPGRRVALLIDASISMLAPFVAENLNDPRIGDPKQKQPAFYTTVAAAKRFVELRRKSKYHDLMALVEFGDEAYVVTPFTNDYDNILLSVSLIGDPVEFGMFPDRGTLIGQAIQQSIELFKAFKFLDASGNMLVIFTDGEDAHAVVNGVDLDEIMQTAMAVKIPVYFVRTNYGKEEGTLVPDELWKPAVAKTGGRFFAAKDENSLLAAINAIDEVSGGTIQVKQYASRQPRFGMFTLVALASWTVGAALKLTVPYFQKLP
jgi:hypothetical protein